MRVFRVVAARWRPQIVSVGIMAVCIGVASGCGVQTFYNNADRFARWQANDYFAMESAQRAYFDAQFDVLWHWHRTTQLPRYRDALRAWQRDLADGMSWSEWQGIVAEGERWERALIEQGAPFAAQLLLSLDDDQRERFERELEHSNARWMKDEVNRSTEQIERAWMGTVEDVFKRFNGRLSSQQRRLLKSAAARYSPERELWVDYRRRWQRALLTGLATAESPRAFTQGFLQLALNTPDYYSAAFAEVHAANERLAGLLLIDLIAAQSVEQRNRLTSTLGELADDFDALIERADAAPGVPECLVPFEGCPGGAARGAESRSG